MISLQSAMMWGWWVDAAAVLVNWRWNMTKSGDLWATGICGVWGRQLCCADSSTVAQLFIPVQLATLLNSSLCGAFIPLVMALNKHWWTVGRWGSGSPLPPLKWSAQVKMPASNFKELSGTKSGFKNNTNICDPLLHHMQKLEAGSS